MYAFPRLLYALLSAALSPNSFAIRRRCERKHRSDTAAVSGEPLPTVRGTHLLVRDDRVPEVAQEVVRVPQVPEGASLGGAVPQRRHQREVLPGRWQRGGEATGQGSGVC